MRLAAVAWFFNVQRKSSRSLATALSKILVATLEPLGAASRAALRLALSTSVRLKNNDKPVLKSKGISAYLVDEEGDQKDCDELGAHSFCKSLNENEFIDCRYRPLLPETFKPRAVKGYCKAWGRTDHDRLRGLLEPYRSGSVKNIHNRTGNQGKILHLYFR